MYIIIYINYKLFNNFNLPCHVIEYFSTGRNNLYCIRYTYIYRYLFSVHLTSQQINSVCIKCIFGNHLLLIHKTLIYFLFMNPCFHSLLLELIMLQEIYTICIYWILLSSPLSNDPRMEYILLFFKYSSDDEADVFI